jgi:phosphate transport system substrate-binding protein
MKKAGLLLVVLAILSMVGTSFAQTSRDYVTIVGSSTVYPFSTVVAEKFGKGGQFKTPKIESTGTGGGLKLFCGGVGVQHPDMANASRRIKKSEFDACQAAGVKDVVEVKIGFDGIVLANAKKAQPMKLTRKDLFLALAKEVPDPKGGETTVPNPYKTWKDVNPVLPDVKITVLGPPPTSGTRDAFTELVMEAGAKQFPWIKALEASDAKKFKSIAHTVREDGAYVEAGENDNLIVQKLEVNPQALGIFGFSFLDQNTDKIQGAFIEEVQPNFDAIASGKYPVSRPLFFYVKKAHIGVVPGIKEYVAEFTSDKAWGPDGYLAEKGMIPLPDAERAKVRDAAQSMTVLTAVE